MKRVVILLFILLSVFSFSSCTDIENDTSLDKVLFVDSEGEKEVSYNPTNVALLYPSFGDIWNATGGNITIGVEDLITRGYADSDITIVGNGTGKNIDIEALVNANPDFTILSSDFPNHVKIAESLKSFGMAYALFDFSTFEDYLNILSVFSKINQCSDIYEKYGGEVEAKINTVIEGAKNKPSKRVLLLRAMTTTIKALDKSNFVGTMINDLKCINIADTNSMLTATLSMESIIRLDPEVILVVPMGDEDKAFALVKNELAKDVWKTISAVKNNKVYYMEKDLFHYKPNLKWGDAYEILSQRIFSE